MMVVLCKMVKRYSFESFNNRYILQGEHCMLDLWAGADRAAEFLSAKNPPKNIWILECSR